MSVYNIFLLINTHFSFYLSMLAEFSSVAVERKGFSSSDHASIDQEDSGDCAIYCFYPISLLLIGTILCLLIHVDCFFLFFIAYFLCLLIPLVYALNL